MPFSLRLAKLFVCCVPACTSPVAVRFRPGLTPALAAALCIRVTDDGILLQYKTLREPEVGCAHLLHPCAGGLYTLEVVLVSTSPRYPGDDPVACFGHASSSFATLCGSICSRRCFCELLLPAFLKALRNLRRRPACLFISHIRADLRPSRRL